MFCSIFIESVPLCVPVEAVNFQMQVSSTCAVIPTMGVQPECNLRGR